MSAVERVDFAAPEPPDPVEAELAREWRGYPLRHSRRAQLAASRYGLHYLALGEDMPESGHYPGVADDACITVFCALCAAGAGVDLPKSHPMRDVLVTRSLDLSRAKLAALLGEFVDAFDIDVAKDVETYDVASAMIAAASKSEVVPVDGDAPGKQGEGGTA